MGFVEEKRKAEDEESLPSDKEMRSLLLGKLIPKGTHCLRNFAGWLDNKMPRIEYEAVKTKTKASSAQGPPDGSTWHWYIIADMTVNEKGECTIRGDKYQAGWSRGVDVPPAAGIDERKLTMMQSTLTGNENKYGLERGGVPEGFAHLWSYADSCFEINQNGSASSSSKTSSASWWEQKKTDRWEIRVSLVSTPPPCQPGTYLLVADQRAEKLNLNQYNTKLTGRLHTFPEGKCAKEEYLQQLHQLMTPPKKPSPLANWIVKRPKVAS